MSINHLVDAVGTKETPQSEKIPGSKQIANSD
jgi:hypothetical protein